MFICCAGANDHDLSEFADSGQAIGANSNGRTLLPIAGFAQQLNVSLGVATAHRQRDDVVVLKPLSATARHAPTAIALPHEHPNVFWDRDTLITVKLFEVLEGVDLAFDFR